MQTSDVVVLAPGLQGALEECLDRTVQIVPCTTHPTHALASGLRHLLDYLGELRTKTLSRVERIPLVDVDEPVEGF